MCSASCHFRNEAVRCRAACRAVAGRRYMRSIALWLYIRDSGIARQRCSTSQRALSGTAPCASLARPRILADVSRCRELPISSQGVLPSQTRKYFRRMLLFRQMDFECVPKRPRNNSVAHAALQVRRMADGVPVLGAVARVCRLAHRTQVSRLAAIATSTTTRVRRPVWYAARLTHRRDQEPVGARRPGVPGAAQPVSDSFAAALLAARDWCRAVSSVGCAVVFGLTAAKFMRLLLWVVFVDFIGVGLVIATALWCVVSEGGG